MILTKHLHRAPVSRRHIYPIQIHLRRGLSGIGILQNDLVLRIHVKTLCGEQEGLEFVSIGMTILCRLLSVERDDVLVL